MEYSRAENNRIQAGFALHAGKLLAQYERVRETFPLQDRYDATLTLCVLQALLTNCHELLRESQNNPTPSRTDERCVEPISTVCGLSGIMHSFVKTNTFSKSPRTNAQLIAHLRNALSHPVGPASAPTTGYTSIPDGSGIVSRIHFTDVNHRDSRKVFEVVLPLAVLTSLARNLADYLAGSVTER